MGSVFQVRGGEGVSLGSPGGDLPKAEAVHSSLELFSGKMTCQYSVVLLKGNVISLCRPELTPVVV